MTKHIPMDSSHQNNQRRKGKGRQKITIEKIENETNRQVTFSKRRAGLFKKASELSTLCGVESAIVVFSPSEKAHSFGSPSVETITNRFLNQTGNIQLLMAHGNPTTHHQRNQELTDLERRLELENRHKKEQNRMRKANQNQMGTTPNLCELSYKQLKELKKSLMSLKHGLETKMKNDTNMGANSSYVQVSNPDVGIRGGFPVTSTQGGPNIGHSLDTNIQGSNYRTDLYHVNIASLDPGGFLKYPSVFDVGASSSTNVAFSNSPGASEPSATFFPDMIAIANHGFFDPMDGNIGLPFPYLRESSGSNYIFPCNYVLSNDIVSHDVGTSTNTEAEHEGVPRGTQDYDRDDYEGFNNYDHGN
ncbi:hypothetical protein OROGR_009746 [Orobanche gracilis]